MRKPMTWSFKPHTLAKIELLFETCSCLHALISLLDILTAQFSYLGVLRNGIIQQDFCVFLKRWQK